MIYLASPYSHKDPEVRFWRYTEACRVAAELMVGGAIIFSPIAHTHPIAKYGKLDALDADFYLKFDKEFLRFSNGMWVLTLDGWKESYGIGVETNFAHEQGIQIKYIDPTTLELTHEGA